MFALVAVIIFLLGMKPRFSLTDSKTWVLGYVFLTVVIRSFTLLVTTDAGIAVFRISPQGAALDHDIAIAHLQTALGLVAYGIAYNLFHRRLGATPAATASSSFRISYPTALALVLLSAALLPAQIALSSANANPTVGGDFILALPGYAAAGAGCILAYTFWRQPKAAVPILVIAATDAAIRIVFLDSKASAFALMTGLFIGYVARVPWARKISLPRGVIRFVAIPVLGVVALLVFSKPLSLGTDDFWSRLSAGAGAAISRSYGTDGLISVNTYLHDGHPLLMGSSLGEIVISWVPRQLWPEKPRSFSERLGDSIFAYRPDAGRVFFAPGFSGEWLLNFGPIGLVFGWLLFGSLSAYVDARVPLPYKALWLFALVHLVEGPVVPQFWLSAPFIVGGRVVLRRTYEVVRDTRR
jgi:hypothetical protein